MVPRSKQRWGETSCIAQQTHAAKIAEMGFSCLSLGNEGWALLRRWEQFYSNLAEFVLGKSLNLSTEREKNLLYIEVTILCFWVTTSKFLLVSKHQVLETTVSYGVWPGLMRVERHSRVSGTSCALLSSGSLLVTMIPRFSLLCPLAVQPSVSQGLYKPSTCLWIFQNLRKDAVLIKEQWGWAPAHAMGSTSWYQYWVGSLQLSKCRVLPSSASSRPQQQTWTVDAEADKVQGWSKQGENLLICVEGETSVSWSDRASYLVFWYEPREWEGD